MAPRVARPICPTEYVGIYSDACASDGFLEFVASVADHGDGIRQFRLRAYLMMTGSSRSFLQTNEIYGLEMSATVAAVVALGELLRGEGDNYAASVLSIGSYAAAGASIKASPRAPVVAASIASFRVFL